MEDCGGNTSVETAIAAAAFVQTIQRDLNFLTDPDRNTRRKGLERLNKRLTQGDAAAPPPVLQIVWDETVLKIVLKNLYDPVEKCRELVLNLMTDVVKTVPQVERTIRHFAPTVAERIGQLPILEESEEIRLSLLNLMLLVISRCDKGSIHEIIDPICRVICFALADPFHDIKKAACLLTSAVANHVPNDVSENSEALVRVLLLSVGHAHSRVRLAIMSALDSVVCCGLPASLLSDTIAPGIKAIAFDQSNALRELFFTCLARWLGYGDAVETRNPKPYISQILPLLLLGITDRVSDISSEVLKLVEGVGAAYEKREKSKDEMQVEQRNTALPNELLFAPFTGIPEQGCRRMVQDFLGQLLSAALKDLQDWTTMTRVGASRLLQTALIFAEEKASSHLDLLMAAFCSAVGDEEVEVAQRIVRAAQILGFYTTPCQWMDLVMDPIANVRYNDRQRANALVVLAALLYGTPVEAFDVKTVVQISHGLSEADTLLNDHSAVQTQLLAVLTNIIRKAGDHCKVCLDKFLVLLLQLQSTPADAQIRFSSRCLIDSLARVTGYESSKELYTEYVSLLLQRATLGHEEWLGSSRGKLLFHTVLQSCGSLVGPYLQGLLPVFSKCILPDRDPALRISMLQLLDELFEMNGLECWWTCLAKMVIKDILVPCGVWQIGKIGAAIRHAAMVALGTFLRRDLCSQSDLMELLESEEMLPVVISCLEEDFYVDTRRVSCHVMENILRVAGTHLKEEQRVQIGNVLQKRLDDSNDDVRLVVLRAVGNFFSTLPQSYSDSVVKGFLSVLLLHMDDQNGDIKRAVCNAVEQCALRKAEIVIEVVKEGGDRHKSREYCDYLLTLASSVHSSNTA